MRGTVTKACNSIAIGTITDESGAEYFFHYSNFPKNHVKKGYIVDFDAFDEGKKKLRAVNIKLVSYGVNHPFCNNILGICKFIEENTPDTEEKEYKLRDLQMLYAYFADLEDLDLQDIRKKYRPEKYTLRK